MNYDDKETLSQLMDGEWQDLDSAKSVKAACADEKLQSTWSRYHLIRDVMRNDAITVDTSLTLRISQAIQDEPAYSNVSAIGATAQPVAPNGSISTEIQEAVSANKTSSYLRTGLGGFALAACVALATVLGLNFWQGAPATINTTQTVANLPATTPMTGFGVPGVVLPEVEYVSNKGTHWVTPQAERSPSAERRLNALLSAHIESSPTAERTGMLPYSRLVGYDTDTTTAAPAAPEQ